VLLQSMLQHSTQIAKIGCGPSKSWISCALWARRKECFGTFWELENFSFRMKCVASINDGIVKMTRLAVDRLKTVFLVPTGLVEKNAFGPFGVFKL